MGSTNRLAIMRQACLRAGVEPIETLTDDTDEARILVACYDDLVEAYIERGLWKFAKKQVVLSRLSNETASVNYEAVYQLPADMIYLETVYADGARLTDYDRFYGANSKTYLHCNCTADQEVIADYVSNTSEASWAPTFKHVIISALAEMLATGLREDGRMADYFAKQTQMFGGVAAARDDQQQPARRLPVSRFINTRRSRGRLGL